MKLVSGVRLLCLISLPLFAETALGAEDGPRDNPYVSGMPSHEVVEVADKDFDAFKFCPGKKTETVEGRVWSRNYMLREGAKQPSELQIVRNYANAVRSQGGTVLLEGSPDSSCDRDICMNKLMTGKFSKGGKEIWVEAAACNDGLDYWLTVVEKEGMRQDVTANAGELLKALNAQGHVALYINFDFGKSTIRPESKPTLDEVAKMLRNSPDLKLGVEGHTDNVGDPRKNKALSDERAKSVVTALAGLGIDARRLTPAGFGQDKPVADNASEQGRAKNRRVELVKK